MGRARNEHLFDENLAGIPSEEDDDLQPSTRKRPLRSTIIDDDGSTNEEEEDSLNKEAIPDRPSGRDSVMKIKLVDNE